jgi:hypothetical protein
MTTGLTVNRAVNGLGDGGGRNLRERKNMASEEAEMAARAFSKTIGYTFKIMTDGTIILEPPPDPECCAICRNAHAKLS